MKNEHNPERLSPEIVIIFGESELALNYFNTAIYRFHAPYQHLNHVFYHPEGSDTGCYIFNNPDLVRSLRKAAFPEHKQAWPEPVDEKAWLQYETSTFDAEAEQLFKEGEAS